MKISNDEAASYFQPLRERVNGTQMLIEPPPGAISERRRSLPARYSCHGAQSASNFVTVSPSKKRYRSGSTRGRSNSFSNPEESGSRIQSAEVLDRGIYQVRQMGERADERTAPIIKRASKSRKLCKSTIGAKIRSAPPIQMEPTTPENTSKRYQGESYTNLSPVAPSSAPALSCSSTTAMSALENTPPNFCTHSRAVSPCKAKTAPSPHKRDLRVVHQDHEYRPSRGNPAIST